MRSVPVPSAGAVFATVVAVLVLTDVVLEDLTSWGGVLAAGLAGVLGCAVVAALQSGHEHRSERRR